MATRICAGIAIVLSLFGAFLIKNGLDRSETVFQQIESIVYGLAYVIIPYCICKLVHLIETAEKAKEVVPSNEKPQEVVTELTPAEE